MKYLPSRFSIKKIVLIAFAIIVIYSILPVAGLYTMKSPASYTNQEATEKLKYNKGEYFEFIVFGDSHSGIIFDDSLTMKILNRINREDRFKKIPIDFVISTGDVSFRGSEWDYRTYNKIRSLVKWPVISAIGNHDSDQDGLERFKKYIGETDFSFGNRKSYFIFLDNRRGDITETQFANLEEELKRSELYKHRFIIMHKSPFAPYQQSWYRPELSDWSYRFRKLCEKYKVDMVFSGHEHMFKKDTFGPVGYIITGGAGMFTLIPSSGGGFPHYVVVRVNGDYVDYEIRKVFPPLWEFLTYYIWLETFYFLKDVIL